MTMRILRAALVVIGLCLLGAPALVEAKDPVSGVVTAIDPEDRIITVKTSAGQQSHQFAAVAYSIAGKSTIDGRPVRLGDFKVGDRVRLGFNSSGRQLIHIEKD